MKKLLKISELRELLEVSCRAIYEWVHIGFIPHYKFPKGVRFKLLDIEQWMNKRKKHGRVKYKIDIHELK
ncbi:MAG: helix-turn-helix domain-containing protein [Candidatus Omnitrophica bacterium]|nr:helix-turn-helix domain-containing protein [Candidatus Omnitrophota bacterium]